MKKQKWIRVNKKIPNFYTDVFLHCEYDKTTTIGFANEENGEFIGFKMDGDDNYHLEGVTHWMPINYPNDPK